MRGDKGKEEEPEDSENRKRRYTEEGRAKARERFTREDTSSPSGFGRKPRTEDDYSDDDDDDDRGRGNKVSRRSTGCKRFLPGAARFPQRRPRPPF